MLDELPPDSRDSVTGLLPYPPFAAVLMAPLAPLPSWVAAGLWTAASVAALAAVVALVHRSPRPARARMARRAPRPGCGRPGADLAEPRVRPGQHPHHAGRPRRPARTVAALVRRAARDRGRSEAHRSCSSSSSCSWDVAQLLGARSSPSAPSSSASWRTGGGRLFWGHGLIDAGRIGPPPATQSSVYGRSPACSTPGPRSCCGSRSPCRSPSPSSASPSVGGGVATRPSGRASRQCRCSSPHPSPGRTIGCGPRRSPWCCGNVAGGLPSRGPWSSSPARSSGPATARAASSRGRRSTTLSGTPTSWPRLPSRRGRQAGSRSAWGPG